MLLDQPIKHVNRPWVGLYCFNREENFVNLGERLRAKTIDVEDLLRVVVFQFLAHLLVRGSIASDKDSVLGKSFARVLPSRLYMFVLLE